MKIFFIAACLICFSILVKAQRNIDVLHYKYEIELNDNTDTIKGRATIFLKFLQQSETILLDFNTAIKNAKGMLAYPYLLNGNTLPGSSSPGKLLLKLPIVFKESDTLSVIIEYKGIPSDGLIISKNQFGKRTFFADNWPNRAHNWIPCVDDPADKAAVEFIVTAPSHYQVVSNGLQIEESNLPGNKKLTHWKEDVPLPTKVMVIAAADFAVNYAGEVNCVPVFSWVFPENKQEGFYDYAPAKEILSYYINYIGPYAYKKLANIQSKTRFGGMENASAIFYAEQTVTGTRQEEELISHEIVHQWFGNMATEKSFAHLWLSEGFATYLTHVFIESKYGTDSLNKEMQYDREIVIDFVNNSKRPVVDSTSDYMSLLNANSYKKGSWVLHMLRRELGDSVFQKSIRQYYAAYAGKNADTRDVQKIFEEVSGKDLSNFFQQWLYIGENPKLDITWKYIQKEKKIQVTVLQTQQGVVFNLPLDFEITFTDGKKIIKQILLDNQSIKADWPVNSKPVTLKSDPYVSLLFEGS
ncbi:MAG: M1 family metallopeptidase, partial [Chitinophagaceae bacterium]